MDWSEDWRKTADYPDETFLDLLNHARRLSCRDPRDHIYAYLGHPLARSEDGRGLIVDPDYSKDPMDVWYELAVQLVKRHGLRSISPVEHNNENCGSIIPPGFPSVGPKSIQVLH